MFFYFVFFFKSSAPGPWKPDAAAHGTLLFLFFFFFFFSSSSFSSFSSSCSLIWRTCYLFVWFFFSTFGLVISATHFRRLAARTAGPRSSFVFDIFRVFFFLLNFCPISAGGLIGRPIRRRRRRKRPRLSFVSLVFFSYFVVLVLLLRYGRPSSLSGRRRPGVMRNLMRFHFTLFFFRAPV